MEKECNKFHDKVIILSDFIKNKLQVINKRNGEYIAIMDINKSDASRISSECILMSSNWDGEFLVSLVNRLLTQGRSSNFPTLIAISSSLLAHCQSFCLYALPSHGLYTNLFLRLLI